MSGWRVIRDMNRECMNQPFLLLNVDCGQQKAIVL